MIRIGIELVDEGKYEKWELESNCSYSDTPNLASNLIHLALFSQVVNLVCLFVCLLVTRWPVQASEIDNYLYT